MSDLTPRYTHEVHKAARQIRKIVGGLTLTELIALREALSGDWPVDPLAGVREPRTDRPDSGTTGAQAVPESAGEDIT